MITKTKIGIIALIIGSFVVGGFAFNAYQQAGAAETEVVENGNWHGFGFFRGGNQCDLSGLEKDSPEWQAKMEECKAEREAKMEEFRANRPENGEWKGRGLKSEHLFGFRELMRFSDEVNHEVVNLVNGVQLTITSDNSEIVQKLQDAAAKMNNPSEE